MPEHLVLSIEQLASSNTGMVISHELSGDANFIWEEIGILLVDPLLKSFSLKRDPERVSTAQEVFE